MALIMETHLPLILFGLSILFWWLILTPTAIYYLWSYYRHRQNILIRHRHWQIVVLFGVFCILFWCIDRPLQFVCKLQEIRNLLTTTNSISTLLDLLPNVHHFLFPVVLHGVVGSIVWRYYMLWYNIKFFEENINMKWKIIINDTNYSPKHGTKRFNWFLAHQTKLGSLKYLTPRICAVFLLLVSLSIFAHFYQPFIAHVIDAVISFVCVCILIALWCQTPIIQHTNHLQIQSELKCVIALCSLQYLAYFGATLLLAHFWTGYGYYDEITFLFVESWLAVLFTLVIFIIFTKWTLRKCNTMNPNASSSRMYNQSHSQLPQLGNINTSSSSRKLMPLSPRGKQLKLYECLQCNEGFSSFMNHCFSEISHECLLFLIESIQFKQQLSVSYTYVLGVQEIKENIGSVLRRLGETKSCSSLGTSPKLNHSRPPIGTLNHIALPLAQIQQDQSLSCKHSVSSSRSYDDKDDDEMSVNTQISMPSPAITPAIMTTTSIISSTLSEGSYPRSPAPAHQLRHQQEILTIKFPDCVPKSFIVFNTKQSDRAGHERNGKAETKEEVLAEFKWKALQLFNKYVYTATDVCPYEINVNYNMRKKLINLMADKEKWMHAAISFDQLYVMFDECCLEMYDLCCHSFKRFKQTAQFAKLDKKIFCKSSFPNTLH